MSIAIIPARGGSKRIAHKNSRLFHGKPMIAYSIEAAINSRCFERIIVSTDSEDIARIARHYGAETPFVRPAEIADDYATTLDVINHAISWAEGQGIAFDNLCCIYATAPFITIKALRDGHRILNTTTHNYAFTATRFSYPIQRALKSTAAGTAAMFSPENYAQRSQDLEPAYHDAGQFYWGRKSAFKSGKAIFDDDAYMIMLEPHQVQDIDTESDWIRAEALYAINAQLGK
ncbi:MAG: pseudaminic acid cytidylyltransferase [Marinagarivorans sp.]|nr:pseudaminic acid cytidylyltransferase [Marinagarivorans sp.]